MTIDNFSSETNLFNNQLLTYCFRIKPNHENTTHRAKVRSMDVGAYECNVCMCAYKVLLPMEMKTIVSKYTHRYL